MEEGRRQRERKREKVNGGGGAGKREREDGVVGRSEKIGEATEERRRRETERSLPSLPRARTRARERERMQFKTHTGDPCVSSTHTRA